MFDTILVPTDGSPLSDKAIDAAVKFAAERGGRLVALSVAEPYPFSPLSELAMSDERKVYDDRAREAAAQKVEKVAIAAREAKVACEALVRQSFAPSEEIVAVAKEKKCDVIFMASHGRTGLSRLFVGSETQKVLAHSELPVLVFR